MAVNSTSSGMCSLDSAYKDWTKESICAEARASISSKLSSTMSQSVSAFSSSSNARSFSTSVRLKSAKVSVGRGARGVGRGGLGGCEEELGTSGVVGLPKRLRARLREGLEVPAASMTTVDCRLATDNRDGDKKGLLQWKRRVFGHHRCSGRLRNMING